MPRMIRIAVVEDDAMERDCLEAQLNRAAGLTCAGMFSSVEDGLEGFGELRADVLLIDVNLPGGYDGLRGTELFKRQWPRLKVLVLSNWETNEIIMEAFAMGADGFLIKVNTPPARLEESIRDVYEGGSPMSDRVRRALREFHFKRRPLLGRLSPMEKRILQELDAGSSNKEIAAKLGISPNTSQEHMRRIVTKSLVLSRGEASFVRRQVAL